MTRFVSRILPPVAMVAVLVLMWSWAFHRLSAALVRAAQ